MKKQYVFLLLLLVILYIIYLIIAFSYREYKINSNIDYIQTLNDEIRDKNAYAEEMIQYKRSPSYRNMILKEDQSFQNKGEKVVYLTTQQTYDKFTKQNLIEEIKQEKVINTIDYIIDSMTIYEKWIYYIFWKDVR